MFEHHLWAREVLIEHRERLPAQQLDASAPERVDRRLGLQGLAREPFCPDGLEVFERWRAESHPS
jgi:hypothetical protein